MSIAMFRHYPALCIRTCAWIGYPSSRMAIERRSPQTKAEMVYEALHRAIISGRLKAGEPLRQEVVAERWGVSQTPVREAFRRLEAEGLVEHAPNRGVVVRGIASHSVAPLDALA